MPKYLPPKVSERGGRRGEAYSLPVLIGRRPSQGPPDVPKETRRAEDHRHRCSQGCRGVAEVQGGHDRRVVGGRVGRVQLRCDGWQQPSREHLGRPRPGGLPGSAAFVLAGIGGGGGTSRDDPTGDDLHQEVARSLVVAGDLTGTQRDGDAARVCWTAGLTRDTVGRMAEVTIRELRNRGGEVVDRVAAGERLTV